MKIEDPKRRLLAAAGLKITPARIAVLEIFDAHPQPLDAGEIYHLLEQKKISKDVATVYRILENFFEKKLIARIEFGEGKFRYEKKGIPHHHVICENCGRVVDISDCPIDDFENEVMRKTGYEITRHSLEFFGLCSVCQRKNIA